MKQVIQNLRNGQTTVADVPAPVARPGMAVVRTAASLVSAGTERMLVEFAEKSLVGKARSRPDLVRQVLERARREGLLTTLEAAFNRLDQPLPLGYSSAGTILELGPGMDGFRVGQRVACAGGGYAVHAEVVAVPRNLLVPLPDEVDFESAAFATLGAIALHGFRLGGPQVGERVGVIGLGLLGLLTVQIARAAGCEVFGVDLDRRRVALAARFGAEAVLRSRAGSAARSFSRGLGLDLVLICADTPSADPVELAGEIARDRGRVVAVGAVGLTLPRKVYYEKELSFINSRSYGPGRYDPAYEEGGHDYPPGYVRWTEGRNLEAVVGLMASGRLDVHPLITHRFPIEQAPRAYEIITGKRKENFLGVVLTYPAGKGAPGRRVEIAPLPRLAPAPVALGVLGAGLYANATLLPAIRRHAGTARIAIASAGGLHAQHAARKFGFAFAASGEDEILKDARINTVAILTRHGEHARQVVAALKAGKHVFVEKPLALDEAGLKRVEKQLRASPDCLLTVGFNRRFAPLAVRLKEFLDGRSQPLVAHYRVNAGYIPLSHWVHDPQQGGGRLLGEGCHFIDFLTFLVGAPPVRVSAAALPDAGLYREDNFILTFVFPDGSLGAVTYVANGDKSFAKERIEVFCEGRVAVLDDFRTLELVQGGRRRLIRSPWRQDKGHAAGWAAFAQAVRAGGPPPIPYEHLFGVTRASLAALDALRSGQPRELD